MMDKRKAGVGSEGGGIRRRGPPRGKRERARDMLRPEAGERTAHLPWAVRLLRQPLLLAGVYVQPLFTCAGVERGLPRSPPGPGEA